MSDKRMLIVPAELIKRIDDNRGDMSQADFVTFLIDSQFKEEVKRPDSAATKEEMRAFEQDIKNLLRSFLDFFVSYGLDLGKQSDNPQLADLNSKLQGLEANILAEEKEKKATIRWK
jgi:hypothetical protein